MALITKKGYGQVEPNHLSAQRTGQIYAQLPYDGDTLQNGAFLKYDYANGKAQTTGTGEFMLVFCEIKNYASDKVGMKDFVMEKENYIDGVITPRLFKINDGDIFTTNLADITTASGSRKGKLLVPTLTGDMVYLKEKTTPVEGDMVFEVIAETTMPDGQYAVKVRKIYTKGATVAGA